MSRIKVFKDVIDSLKQLTDNMETLYQVLSEDEKHVADTQHTVTLEEVRGVLADKSRLGFTKEIKALLIALGADKLSDVKSTDYAILLKQAEALGNE